MKFIIHLLFFFMVCHALAQTTCSEYVETWYLKEINIGSLSQFISANEEVVNVTLECPYNSNNEFITTYCQTGMANIEQIAGGDIVFINEEFTIDGDSCAEFGNPDLEQLYFSFFIDNVDQQLEFEVGVIDFIPPPGPSSITYMVIGAPNGDYLYYEDYPLMILNTQEFTANSVVLLPNPVAEIFKIYQRNNDFTLSEISIYNINGALVETHPLTNSTEINIAHLKTGMYFAQIKTDDNQRLVKRLIKK